jgi:hypothetical protein
LQALAIRENKVHVHGSFAVPAAPASVYLDIEGLPDRGSYYLIGLLVVDNGRREPPLVLGRRGGRTAGGLLRAAGEARPVPGLPPPTAPLPITGRSAGWPQR